MLKEVIVASVLLDEQFSISAEVGRITSFSELAIDDIAIERGNRLCNTTEQSYVTRALGSSAAPAIAVSGDARAVAETIRAYAYIRQRRHLSCGFSGNWYAALHTKLPLPLKLNNIRRNLK